METDNYQVIEHIGQGPFGSSFLVLHKQEQKKFVLKKFRLAKQTEKFKNKALQEINQIVKLHNPYIVEYKDSWIDKENYVGMVAAYYEGGDMVKAIKKAGRTFFAEEKLCKWMTQLLLAVDYLHSNRVIHRDLKCSNIFLTKDKDIRVGAIGLEKVLSTEELASPVLWPLNYICPEVLEDIPYGYKSDIWSLGCCLFEMAAHQPAYKASDKAGLIKKINRSLMSPLPIDYSSTLKQLIKSMLRKNPEHRPTASELLRHAHLQPYLLQCHNAAPVYLPVFPVVKKKVKKSRNSLSGRSTSSNDTEDREVVINQMVCIESHETDSAVKLKDVSGSKKLATGIATEINHETRGAQSTGCFEKLSYGIESSNLSTDSNTSLVTCIETRGVESTGCSENLSNGIVYSNNVSAYGKAFGCEGNDVEVTANILLNLEVEEQEESASDPSCWLHENHRSGVTDETPEEFCDKRVLEEVEHEGKNVLSHDCQLEMSNVNCTENSLSIDGNSSSLATDTRIDENISSPKCNAEKTGSSYSHAGGSVEHPSSKSFGIDEQNDETGAEANSIPCSVKAEKDNVHIINQVPNGTLLLNTITALRDAKAKNELDEATEEKADALESLLEVCAQLMKQDKLEELARVLRPFGDETVSSRETAIWLTKSLISAQKSSKPT